MDSNAATPSVGEKSDSRPALQKALMETRLIWSPGYFTAHFNLGAALATEGGMLRPLHTTEQR